MENVSVKFVCEADMTDEEKTEREAREKETWRKINRLVAIKTSRCLEKNGITKEG